MTAASVVAVDGAVDDVFVVDADAAVVGGVEDAEGGDSVVDEGALAGFGAE